MKSRFFSTPGLLVHVSDIVSITCDSNDDDEMAVLYRTANFVTIVNRANAKAIAEYVEEYEAATQAQWTTPEAAPAISMSDENWAGRLLVNVGSTTE